MQEQNFEKQVQQKMEELSFVPSEPVWQKVEEQIAKKKDKRRLIFWLLPFLLLGGGYFLLRNNDSLKDQTSVSVVNSSGEKESKTENNHTNAEATIDANKKEQAPTQSQLNIKHTIPPVAHSNVGISGINKKIARQGSVKSDKNKSWGSDSGDDNFLNSIAQRDEKETSQKNSVADNKTVEDVTTENVSTTVAQDKKTDETSATISSTQNNNNKEKDDSIAKSQQVISIQPDTATKAPDSSTIVKTIQLKRKWAVSFKAAIGISSLSNNLDLFGTIAGSQEKSTADLYADPRPSAQSANNFSNAAAAPPVSLPPSPVYKNISYAVGIDVRKKLTKRLAVVTGLQYNYYSTWQFVGKKIENNFTSRNNFSGSNNPSEFYLNSAIAHEKYVTKYHFLSIPIGVDYQLSDTKPFNLALGIEAGQLLSTNALYYDKLAGVYYEKNGLFRKTQLFGTASLTYRLFNNKLGALYLGPQMQFGFSNLLAKKSDGTQHLIAAGLTTRFAF